MRYLLLAVMLLSSACHPYYLLAPNMSGYIVRIESDTDWEGVVGSQAVSGFQTQSFPVTVIPHTPICWNVRKSRYSSGMLRVFLTYRDYHTGSTTHPRWGDSVTIMPLGVVRQCVTI